MQASSGAQVIGLRGACSVCGQTRAIDMDGMVRRHRRPGSLESGPIAASRDLCLGSWELPLAPPVC